MAREQHTRYPYREQYRGEDFNQRYQQGRERDAWYGTEEARLRDDRHWQQGPDDWNSPSSSRQSMDEGTYNDGPSSRDRGETYRSRGNAEWEPYDRGASRYRNGASNQADGYGQDFERYQNGRRTVAPTNGYDRNNGPYNGQYADRHNGSTYGDTRNDNYGGGGYNGGMNAGRGSSGRQDERGYGHRTDAPYYGAEFIQDMERGRSDTRYGQRGDGMDSQSNFSGRGPKGWKRSDERIQEELNEQLERHPMIDASEIEVKVEGGEVTLSGTTSDRRMKRMAEDIAENVSGVREVQNQIRLQKADGQNGAADRKHQSDQSDSKQQGRRSSMTS